MIRTSTTIRLNDVEGGLVDQRWHGYRDHFVVRLRGVSSALRLKEKQLKYEVNLLYGKLLHRSFVSSVILDGYSVGIVTLA